MSGPLLFRTVPNYGEQEPSAMGIDALAEAIGLPTLKSITGAKGVGDETDKLNAGISYLNKARYKGFIMGGASYSISDALIPLVQSDITIVGGGSNITNTVNGKVWTMGSASTQVGRIRLHDLSYFFSGVPDPNDFLLDMVNCSDSWFGKFYFNKAASLIRYGSASAACQRNVFSQWTGNVNNGALSDANILILNGSSGRFENINFNGPGGGNSGFKAIYKFAPPTGAVVDTFWVDKCNAQLFTSVNPPVDGKAYGLLIDRTLGPVQNIYMKNCNFDHTTTAGLAVIDVNGVTTGADANSRNIEFMDGRFVPDSGDCVLVDFSNANPNLIARGIFVVNNYFVISDNSRIGRFLLGTKARRVFFDGNHCEDLTNTVKDVGVEFTGSNWTCRGNQFGSTTNSTCKITTAIKVSDVASDKFNIEGNEASECANFISEPVYTSPSSNRRIVHDRAYTKAALLAGAASPKSIGCEITLTDGASNKNLAKADGTTWRYPDGVAVT